MHINGVARAHGAQGINAPHSIQGAQQPQSTNQVSEVDQLDISQEAELISRLSDAADVRADRVADIRAQIEAGVYETQDKLDVAVDRLLDEIV